MSRLVNRLEILSIFNCSLAVLEVHCVSFTLQLSGSSGVGFKFGTGLSSTLSQGFSTKPAGSDLASSEAKGL